VTIKPSSEWPDEAAAAVAAIYNTPEGVKVQLHDKPQALGRLAKYLRLLPEPVSVAGGGIQIGRAVIYLPDNGRAVDQLPPASALPLPAHTDTQETGQ
jgi:hypothetical protein